MPYRLWRHECNGREVLQGSPECGACGGGAVFDGWRLGMYESMAAYRYVYDLAPVGPHRSLADRLFAGTPAAA